MNHSIDHPVSDELEHTHTLPCTCRELMFEVHVLVGARGIVLGAPFKPNSGMRSKSSLGVLPCVICLEEVGWCGSLVLL